MKRYGMVLGLREEKIDEYKRLHAAVWPGVLKKIAECNIRNFSIYLRKLPDGKHYLFSYFEYVGEDYDADMETQIRQTFQRIGKVLAASGASFENIVILRSFFVHMARDLPAYRKVRKEFLKQPYPASTAVGTTELAIPGLEIEIEAVAVL